ncbi:MAG: hypothetical protein M3Y48_25415, partial [Actinomycetota bacterium]|nr:hypothetical protein [Actinomycetota bacterium]
IKAVEERVCDQSVLKLLRVMLRAGVVENGSVHKATTGSPQGGLCAAAHNPPNEQRWVMRSAWLLALVGAVVAAGRCA